MNYKEETTKVYDLFPEYFDEKFAEYSNEVIKEELDYIAKMFSKRPTLLDLGSGPGNHALYFKQKGIDVLCADISDEMLKKCKDKGLKIVKADFEKLSFPINSFDIVFAYSSLSHAPKNKMPKILNDINNILKDSGVFAISLKEGKLEGFLDFSKGGKRWFSLYSDNEIRNLLGVHFKIIKTWKVQISNKVYLDYICIKK